MFSLFTLPAILAAKDATSTIPIVMVSNRDPVAVASWKVWHAPVEISPAATLSQNLSGKRLELLTELVPKLSASGFFGLDQSSHGYCF